MGALALLLLSILGTVAALHNGDWSALRNATNWYAVGSGIGIQLLCTVFEYYYSHNKFSIAYVLPLIIDAGSTGYGYAPVILPPLQSIMLWVISGTPALIATYAVIFIAAALLAWIPEDRLID